MRALLQKKSSDATRVNCLSLLLLVISLSSLHCSIPKNINVTFSNVSCQFFLLFFFRKKGFTFFFSLDTSLSYRITPIFIISVLLLFFLHTLWVLVSHMYHLNWITHFATPPTRFFQVPYPSPQEFSSLKAPPPNLQSTHTAGVTPEGALLFLRITGDFCQTFCWFYSCSFWLVSLPWVICLSCFCFSATVDYCVTITQLIFHAYRYAMTPTSNCGFRQWIFRIILTRFEL